MNVGLVYTSLSDNLQHDKNNKDESFTSINSLNYEEKIIKVEKESSALHRAKQIPQYKIEFNQLNENPVSNITKFVLKNWSQYFHIPRKKLIQKR